MKHKYPMEMPSPYNPPAAIRVYNEEQYDEIVRQLKGQVGGDVSSQPSRNKKNKED